MLTIGHQPASSLLADTVDDLPQTDDLEDGEVEDSQIEDEASLNGVTEEVLVNTVMG